MLSVCVTSKCCLVDWLVGDHLLLTDSEPYRIENLYILSHCADNYVGTYVPVSEYPTTFKTSLLVLI
jgi:hypothetical protein